MSTKYKNIGESKMNNRTFMETVAVTAAKVVVSTQPSNNSRTEINMARSDERSRAIRALDNEGKRNASPEWIRKKGELMRRFGIW
jgi:hypothetical protein